MWPSDNASSAPDGAASLTRTQYTSPSGDPLYAECVAPDAPMPPEIPEPAADQSANRMPARDSLPTEDLVDPDKLPAFEFREVELVDAASWSARVSSCFGYTLHLPPDWKGSDDFTVAGYQQGEYGQLESADGSVRIETAYFYSPVDFLERTLNADNAESDQLLSATSEADTDGRPVVTTEVYSSEMDGLIVSRITSPRQDWYFSIVLYLPSPYALEAARQARTILETVELP